MSRKSLGKFIRHKRELLGLSRQEFDNKFHVASGTLQNLEGGHSNFSSTQLLELAKIFGVRPGLLADLLGDAITYEQALIQEARRENGLNDSEGFPDGRFVLLPKFFTQEDHDFLMGVINFISSTYERIMPGVISIAGKEKESEPQMLGKFGEQMPDPWVDLNEQYLLEHKEEIRNWLENQDTAS